MTGKGVALYNYHWLGHFLFMIFFVQLLERNLEKNPQQILHDSRPMIFHLPDEPFPNFGAFKSVSRRS